MNKMINTAATRKPPVAPPVYRPQQAPRVLQTKSALPQRPAAAQAPRHAVSPPEYRRVIKKTVQPKAMPQPRTSPPGLAAHRPEQKRTAPQSKLPVQMKTPPFSNTTFAHKHNQTGTRPSVIAPRNLAHNPKLAAASPRHNFIAVHSPRAAAQLHPLNRPAYAPAGGNNQTVQPFLIEGLVLGGVALGVAAYGAYRYYRHRRRENTINNIRQEQAGLAPMIVGHVEAHHGLGVASTATTVNPLAPIGGRNYQVFINQDDPVGSGGTSPSLMESARIHERTHISADQSYTANAPGESQHIFHMPHALYHSYPIHDRAEELLQAIAADRALSGVQRAHLRSRVKNNAIKPTEWDSTINELLVYTREEGIAANSTTVKLLVTYARENLEHRAGNLARLPRLRPRLGNSHHQHEEPWRAVFTNDFV